MPDPFHLFDRQSHGLGQRLARFKYTAQDTVRQIYHNDHLGNVRALTSETGSIVSQVDYYPFGEELGLTGSPGRYTYNGNEFDDEYGFDLYYYGARYMDPALGRFTTPDPVQDFVNPYS
jgi:RHS repeat-associated protein